MLSLPNMTRRDELLKDLAEFAAQGAGPVSVTVSDLHELMVADLPRDLPIEPVTSMTGRRQSPVFAGVLTRGNTASSVTAEVLHITPWEEWQASLGLPDYLWLVQLAVEARQRSRGDVTLRDADRDHEAAWISYEIHVDCKRLGEAVALVQAVEAALFEVADSTLAAIDGSLANAAKRIQGWGSQPLDELVDRMGEGTSYEKGLRLEELTSRLFAEVPGFTTSGRVRTETEEIDFFVRNESERAVWRRESALLIGECKNWSTACGRQDFTLLKDKLRGRVGRVTCGFLVSWNGFTETVKQQMLRGSEGDLLVIPITGENLRDGVRRGDFPERLEALHEAAVLL